MNTKRRPLIAGNWKMHRGGVSGVELAMECVKIARTLPQVDMVLGPPFTAIAAVAHECDGTTVGVAAQNMNAKTYGAYTGEISPEMLVESGATWVILGHSERRQLFAETDADVASKTRSAIAAKLRPILCLGETLQEREAGQCLTVVKRQLDAFAPVLLEHVKFAAAIAYEPIWAIGTGKVAGPHEAEEVHAAIRGWLAELSPELAETTRILYGGSVKADNAKDLLNCANVDGALIGGASLEAGSFGAIARAAQAIAASS
jgi:triosephosphate isomerase